MIAWMGLLTIVGLLTLILTKTASPLVALIVVPVITSVLAGFGLHTGEFVVHGLERMGPVVGMFVFAILFFGIVTDAGILDPALRRVLQLVGQHRSRLIVGTAVLTLLVHLDGSGAVAFLVVIPAMLPAYDQLGIDRRILACVTSMAAGVNFLPWTGPTLRASAALHLTVTEIFAPLMAVQAVGILFVLATAWWLGKREDRRLSGTAPAMAGTLSIRLPELSAEQRALRRPQRFPVNVVLTVLVIAGLISGYANPAVVFMVGTVIALSINYPGITEQRARIDAHAKTVMMMAGILLAAGVFTGILSDSGMLKAMATVAATHIQAHQARHMPFVLGLVSMPLSLVFDPDSFYLGVLPLISSTGAAFGVPPIQFAQAALLGQMTTGFPVSPLTPATFLVVGLCGIELGEHQKFAIPFLFAASVLMTLAAVALGVFPL